MSVKLTCDHCGKEIKDERAMFTMDDMPGLYFCSSSCALSHSEDLEDDNFYECYVVSCECGNCAEIGVNECRWKMDNFEHIENTDEREDNTAKYKCLECGKECFSTLTNNKE